MFEIDIDSIGLKLSKVMLLTDQYINHKKVNIYQNINCAEETELKMRGSRQ